MFRRDKIKMTCDKLNQTRKKTIEKLLKEKATFGKRNEEMQKLAHKRTLCKTSRGKKI